MVLGYSLKIINIYSSRRDSLSKNSIFVSYLANINIHCRASHLVDRFNLSFCIGLLAVAALSFNVIPKSAAQSTNATEVTSSQLPLYIATTRNYIGNNNILILDPIKLTDFSIDKFGGSCPAETAVYIHGFSRDQTEAGEEFNRVLMSLKENNYTGPLIGFSWNSLPPYEAAKNNALENGPELAKLIFAFKSRCPDTDIHIIAHSLGAEVVKSTLINVNKSQIDMNLGTRNDSKIIDSVHLLGAAIDNKEVAKNTAFGMAIENVVERFYNLYNSQDDGLEVNLLYENKIPLTRMGDSLENITLNYHPLGLVGIQGVPAKNHPFNYNETNVINEIVVISDADGDGNVEECFENFKPVLVKGDNHCGYIGFRQPFMASLINDGAIDALVKGLKE
jgi:hypothetical protein